MTKSLLVLTSIFHWLVSIVVQKCRTKLTMYLNSYQHNSSGSKSLTISLEFYTLFSIVISQVWGANFAYFSYLQKKKLL